MRRPSRTGPAAPGGALGREDVQAPAPGRPRTAGGEGAAGSTERPRTPPCSGAKGERAVRRGIRSRLRRGPAPAPAAGAASGAAVNPGRKEAAFGEPVRGTTAGRLGSA